MSPPVSPRPLSLVRAAERAGVSPETIARWCRRYGIGRQLHAKAPWRVDPLGLAIVMAGDGAALDAWRARLDAGNAGDAA